MNLDNHSDAIEDNSEGSTVISYSFVEPSVNVIQQQLGHGVSTQPVVPSPIIVSH